MKERKEELSEQMLLVKKFCTFGFMFFLLKGMAWLAVVAYLGSDLG